MIKLYSYPFLEEKNCILQLEEFIDINYVKRLKNSINQIICINNFMKVKKRTIVFLKVYLMELILLRVS